MSSASDRRAVLAVIYFLGGYAIASLAIVGVLIAGFILLNVEVTATLVALIGLIANPMSTAVGLIGGLLASTRSNPED